MIGGAYATGREIVEYGAKFGAMGVWSIVAIGAGFSLIAVLAYEFARLYRVYDYRHFVKRLIGPLWPPRNVRWTKAGILGSMNRQGSFSMCQ